MALIFNNKVCVFANELITYNEKRRIGSRSGFIPEGTFQTMKKRKQIVVLQRSTPGTSAIVDFETMREDLKKKYIDLNGDPRVTLSAQSRKGVLEEAIVFSNEAFEFYSTEYRYDGDRKLPDARIDEYTVNVRVLEAILHLRDEHRKNSIGSNGPRVNFWKNISVLCNELKTLRDTWTSSFSAHPAGKCRIIETQMPGI